MYQRFQALVRRAAGHAGLVLSGNEWGGLERNEGCGIKIFRGTDNTTLNVTWSLPDGRMDPLYRITAFPTSFGKFTEDAWNVTTHQNQSADPEP